MEKKAEKKILDFKLRKDHSLSTYAHFSACVLSE